LFPIIATELKGLQTAAVNLLMFVSKMLNDTSVPLGQWRHAHGQIDQLAEA
jgi:hypothetical protein